MSRATFSALIPYYNEADWIEDTLECLVTQTRVPDQIVLVDNGSTDDSTERCRQALAGVTGIDIVYLDDKRPGKIHALETAVPWVTSDFVMLCDADTYYPPHYLALCQRLADESPAAVVAIMALPVTGSAESLRNRFLRRFRTMIAPAWRRQAMVGGYGQVLRMSTLTDVGGFSERYWKHVLLDHEIMQRMFKRGYARYDYDLWCRESGRRTDRSDVRWTLGERLLYHATPFQFKDWFFYDFLDRRLERREMNHLRLREKPWLENGLNRNHDDD